MTNSKRDIFESTGIMSAIISLALPSVMGQIILVLYNMADTYFIGLTGDDCMITAVTVCMPAFMFLSAISNLFGVGGASVISRSLGSQSPDRASRASAFAIWGCIALTAIYSLGALIFVDGFVDILGGYDLTVHSYARIYMLTAVISGGLVTATNTLLSHLLRAEGHSLSAGIGVAIGGLLNIALDPLFMFALLKPGNEVFGAALATALSNAISLIYYVIIIAINRKKLIISARPDGKMLSDGIPKELLSTGLPACLMTLCENISYGVLDNLMHSFGTSAQAGIGVAKKVNMMAHSIVRGIAQGVLPLIGYNYASGKLKRMKKTVFISFSLSIGFACLCTAVCLVFNDGLIGLFIPSITQSRILGCNFLKILCIGAPFSACAYMTISFFQAVGKGFRSLVLALLRKGIVDIPMMFIINAYLPMHGIVYATPITDMLCCLISVIVITVFVKKHMSKSKSV